MGKRSKPQENRRPRSDLLRAAVVDAAAPMSAAGAPPVPIHELLAKLVPELVVVAMALGFALVPVWQTAGLRDGLQLVILIEGTLCLAQGTLTDVASRLKKSPPWWVAIPIVIGIAMFFPETRLALDLAREIGIWVLLGLGWSAAERLRELWTLPAALRAEKLRRRALVGGRIELVLAFAAVAGLMAAVSYLVDDVNGGPRFLENYLGWFIAAFFSLTAFDVWRVHRPSFLQRPRTLLRFDPLGIEYLAPL